MIRRAHEASRQSSLFSPDQAPRPLAVRMRPSQLEDYVGQRHLLGEGGALREVVHGGSLHSMVLWGPPGSGKTSLAHLIAGRANNYRFASFSAAESGIAEIRQFLRDYSQSHRDGAPQPLLLLIDELHRFNKAQQDALLSSVESGVLTMIGATTENPSFEVNNALLSRLRVHVLRLLEPEELRIVINRALVTAQGLENRYSLDDEGMQALIEASEGDARRALNALDLAAEIAGSARRIGVSEIARAVQGDQKRFDKAGDLFYDQISALHKAVRGSAPDAALYWLARMLDGGCDPLYLARRIVRIASEDIGNADPQALTLSLAAWDTQHRLGSPEGELALAQAVVYLATAPKSNAVYLAFKAACRDVRESSAHEPPMHLRNAPTALLKRIGASEGYRYAHDEVGAYVPGECYFPQPLRGRRYYEPVERGVEAKISARLAHWRALDANSSWQRYASPTEQGSGDVLGADQKKQYASDKSGRSSR